MANKPPVDFRRPLRPGAQPSMADFARAVAEGVAGARDRFNNPIQRGHMVTYRADVDPVFEVLDVAPILDPRQPGMVKVTLATTIPLRVMVNQPTQVLMVVGTVPQAAAIEPVHEPAQPTDSALPPTGLVLTDALDNAPAPPAHVDDDDRGDVSDGDDTPIPEDEP